MIEIETLFILGAGASVPYGFPAGKDLRNYISFQFPKRYEELLESHGFFSPKEKRELKEQAQLFADTFYRASIPSIDQFLAITTSVEFKNIGRIAITLAMLDFEKESIFRVDSENKFPNQNWYSLLWSKMTEGLASPESYRAFLSNKVSFITFNYDRSLEHFLYDSFINTYYGNDDAIRLFNKNPFQFTHIYGQIDKPVWEGGRYFGEDYSYTSIEKLKDNIKLIGERPRSLSRDIEFAIKWAKRIFIFGFGFAPENLEILGFNNLDTSQEIFGTAIGFTDSQIIEKKDYFKHRYKGEAFAIKIHITKQNCYQVLNEHLSS